MKKKLAAFAFITLIHSKTFAASDQMDVLSSDIFSTILYSFLGISMAVIAYKTIDFILPGNLNKEIIEEHNVSAGIIAGSLILGICIIIAAVMVN